MPNTCEMPLQAEGQAPDLRSREENAGNFQDCPESTRGDRWRMIDKKVKASRQVDIRVCRSGSNPRNVPDARRWAGLVPEPPRLRSIQRKCRTNSTANTSVGIPRRP